MKTTTSQTALVTGASSGIGKALAKQFAMHAYNLVLISENEDHLEDVTEEIKKEFPHIAVMSIAKDLTDEVSIEEIYDITKQNHIQIDVLVNDAGVGQVGNFWEISLTKHIEIIRLNIEAVTRLIQLFLPEMIQRNSGKILNIGSIAGFQPGPRSATYHASKAYVLSLSESLSEELKDTQVSVTCVCPGPVDTNFFKRAKMEDTFIVKKGNSMNPDEVARIGYRALMDRERAIIPGAANKVLTFMRRIMSIPMQAKLNKKFYEEDEERNS